MASPHDLARDAWKAKIDELMAKGYTYGAATGAADWAWGMAEREADPSREAETFLVRLKYWLERCERWSEGSTRFARS